MENLFSLAGIPVMKTGFSLLGKSTQGNPWSSPSVSTFFPISEFSYFIIDSTHCKPIPVMKTGFSLCTFPNREKTVFITGIPANVNRFFPVWESTQGKPCSGPVLALYVIAVHLA